MPHCFSAGFSACTHRFSGAYPVFGAVFSGRPTSWSSVSLVGDRVSVTSCGPLGANPTSYRRGGAPRPLAASGGQPPTISSFVRSCGGLCACVIARSERRFGQPLPACSLAGASPGLNRCWPRAGHRDPRALCDVVHETSHAAGTSLATRAPLRRCRPRPRGAHRVRAGESPRACVVDSTVLLPPARVRLGTGAGTSLRAFLPRRRHHARSARGRSTGFVLARSSRAPPPWRGSGSLSRGARVRVKTSRLPPARNASLPPLTCNTWSGKTISLPVRTRREQRARVGSRVALLLPPLTCNTKGRKTLSLSTG